jgi:hypothetical protein
VHEPSVLSKLVTVFVLSGLSFFANLVRVGFDVALLWAAMSPYTSVADWPKLELNFGLGLGNPFRDIMHGFFNLFKGLSFLGSYFDSWNCGGALMFTSVFVYVVVVVAVAVLLAGNALIVYPAHIKQRAKENNSKIKGMISEKTAGLFTWFAFGFLQSGISTGARMVTNLFTQHATCSPVDHKLADAAGNTMIVFLILIIAVLVFLFAPLPGDEKLSLSFPLHAALTIINTTLGIWTQRLFEIYKIETVVDAAYGNLPTEDERNKAREDVMYQTAKSRALIWMSFPGCALLCKLADQLNHPMVYSQMPLFGNKLKRLVNWFLSAFQWLMMVILVYNPNTQAVQLLLLTVVCSAITDLLEGLYNQFHKSTASDKSTS